MEDTKIINDVVIKFMPAVALKGKVVLPNVYTSLDVGRIQSLNAVNASIKEEKLLFVVSQKDKTLDAPKSDDLYTI
jgi:ATP-dependent Lon protease